MYSKLQIMTTTVHKKRKSKKRKIRNLNELTKYQQPKSPFIGDSSQEIITNFSELSKSPSFS